MILSFMKYLFVLGRDPELSVAEIEAVLETRKIPFKLLETTQTILLLETQKKLPSLINILGGTIKIAEVLTSETRIDRIEYELQRKEFYLGTSNKITYSFDEFNSDLSSFFNDYLKDYFKQIKLKAQFRSDPTPSQLAISKDHLDFVIFKSHIAKTIEVSNPKELKTRDLARPAVDYMKSTSLRLSKILINLSRIKKDQTLLDPFCGTGSILQEALLLGANVVGMDQDKESIEHVEKNLTWLNKKYKVGVFHLINADAAHLTKHLKQLIDAVVTEPYMGPYIRNYPTMMQGRTLIQELTDLYADVLDQCQRILLKDKYVVIIIPRIKTKEGTTLFIAFDRIAEKHFTIEQKFFYAYPESKILREIYVLKRN